MSKQTIETLRYKADVAADSHDPNDPETHGWKITEDACRFVARHGTVDALVNSKTAMGELENYLAADMPAYERRAIIADLCRAGWYERLDPNIVSTRRPRIQTVDGVKYAVG